MMGREILRNIEDSVDKFSKGQKRIAGFILSDYDKAAFMTAHKLGQKVGVSESTVVRFALALGYSGYPAMQRDLQEVVRAKLTSVQRIEASDQLFGGDVVGSVLQTDMEKIRMAIEDVDRDAFDQVVDKLLKAKHIYILGVRSSSFIAEYFHFYLHMIFESVTLVTKNSVGDVLESLLRIGPGDVLVGISFPRYSNAAVHGIRYAKDRGADVVALTDSDLSPICDQASVSLLVRSELVSFVDSLVAPLSLVNAIIVAAGHRKNKDVAQFFNQLEDIWREYGVFEQDDDEE